jgi:hypothetical protein
MKLKFFVGSLMTLSFFLLSETAWADCKLTDRIYRDVGDRGFELEFLPTPADPPSSMNFARAVIRHPEGGTLYNFYLAESQGYPSVGLVSETSENTGFRINFFDADLTSTSWRDREAPSYAFIADLGSHEYYHGRRRRSETETPILGDVMWKFDRCKAEA